ncbi:hypothetical protein BDY19DRAFT_440949 [Irpex rosettiformis]|uniref:Uncharacterized protein n=1 Tax=Irpex rosettiformis TaxID=378272 RepID=A0ACB8TUD9_9APHY|nr:hypothetical protein BDY19DRAFT_440949 [Irpex rosettiformis]
MKFGGTTGIIRACGDEEPEDEECDPSVASNSCSSPITAQPPGAGCDPIEKREDNTCTQPRATQQGTCGDNDECAAVASCQGKDRQECPDGQYSAQQGNCTDDPGCPPVPACQDKYQPRLKECFGGPRSRQATNGTKCTSDYPGNEECKEDSASCADRSNAETKARNPKFRPLRLSADSTLFQDELSFGFGKPKTPRSNGSNPNQQRTPPRPSSAMKSYFNLITANLQTNQDLQSEELQMNGSACYDANETVQVVNIQSLGKSGMKFGGKTGIIRACGDEEPEGEVCDSSVASNSCSPPGEGCDPIEEREDNPCTQPCATQQGTCVDNDECGAVASCQGKDRQECSDGQCSAQQGNCTDSAVCPPVPACQVKDQLKLEECFDCTGSAVCPPVPACQDQLKLEECCDGDRSYQATNGTECMSDYPGNEECKEDSASCADRSNADTKARNPKFRPLRLSTDSTLFQGELSPGFGKPKTPRSNGSHPNQQRTPPRSSIAMKSDFNLITANLQTNQDPQPEELQMNGSACYDASEAVQVVNSYGQSGLSIQNNAGSVWTANTRDQSLQNTFSQRLRSGTIRGNCFSNVTLGASVTHIGEIADVEVKASSDGEIHRETRLDMFSPMKSLSGSVDGSWRQRLDIVNTIKTVMQVGCVDSARFAAVFEGLQVDSNLFQGVASSVEESYLMSLEIEQAKVGGNGCLVSRHCYQQYLHTYSPAER